LVFPREKSAFSQEKLVFPQEKSAFFQEKLVVSREESAFSREEFGFEWVLFRIEQANIALAS
jgi:hypothetical protein